MGQDNTVPRRINGVEGAVDEVMISGGPGVCESWGAMAAGLAFTELAGIEYKVVNNINVWEDWDLSAIVPAGTVSVLVLAWSKGATTNKAGARKNGTALDRPFTALTIGNAASLLGNNVSCCMLTEVDANRIIDIRGSSLTTIRFGIKGYWS
ncbi:hypothetical protein ES703_91248 [subsurface metagenome]